jgi:hypothetical protein
MDSTWTIYFGDPSWNIPLVFTQTRDGGFLEESNGTQYLGLDTGLLQIDKKINSASYSFMTKKNREFK